MLRGLTQVSVDAKGRMAIPARYRELIAEDFDGCVVATIDIQSPCLLLYPLSIWEGIEKQLSDLPAFDPASRRVQRLMLGHATDLELDGAGRILLPAPLRKYSGLDKKAVLIGQGQKFEIWSEERWEMQLGEYLDPVHESAGESEQLKNIRF